MKPKIVITICLLALAFLWFYYHNDGEPQSVPPTKPMPVVENSQSGERMSVERALELVKNSESTRKQVDQLFEPPVEFYGQVLDQNDSPVVGAKIACYTLPMGPMSSPRKLVSAAPDGRFEIRGFNANSISISFDDIPGYERPPESSKDIQICEPLEKIKLSEEYKSLPPEAKVFISATPLAMPGLPSAYKPDKTKPMIFRLKKLGPTDALYYKAEKEWIKQYGATHYFSLTMRSDGRDEHPQDDHCLGYTLTVNEAESEAYKKNRNTNRQYSWSLRIQVPEGAIQAVPGEHPLSKEDEIFKDNETAPESGYQAEITADYPKTMDKDRWKEWMQGGYFIRFKDGTFARVIIKAGVQSVSITSFYNPTGSRNLVFDYSKRIEK